MKTRCSRSYAVSVFFACSTFIQSVNAELQSAGVTNKFDQNSEITNRPVTLGLETNLLSVNDGSSLNRVNADRASVTLTGTLEKIEVENLDRWPVFRDSDFYTEILSDTVSRDIFYKDWPLRRSKTIDWGFRSRIDYDYATGNSTMGRNEYMIIIGFFFKM